MKFGETQSAMRTVAAGALLLSAVAALTLGPLLPVVAAESDKDPVTTSAIGPVVKMRFLALGIGKSVVVDLPRDVKDVLVADPKIANAVVRSSQRAYIIGAAVGQTNVVFFDADGQQVASYDIAVKRDLNGVRAALRQSMPGIQIEGVGESVLLTGSVSSPVEAQQAGEIAARLVGGVREGRQLDRRSRPRPGDVEGHCRGSPAGCRQTDGHRSQRQHECWQHDREIQQYQSLHCKQRAPRPRQWPWRVIRLDAVGPGGATRDGKRRCSADARRTQSDCDLRRIRNVYLRRRISHSDRRDLPNNNVWCHRTMRPDSQLQEIWHLAQLHAGRAEPRDGSACG